MNTAAGTPHRSASYAALRHTFCVEACDRDLLDYVESAMGALATSESPAHTYRIRDYDSADGRVFELRRDDEPVHRTHRAETVVGALCWNLNRAALASAADLVAVHSAVAARGEHAVLLPAAMESGKTTTVAGLVMRGLRYLTDELAAIDPETLAVHPYPKPLSIDRGSWEVLDALAPTLTPSVRPYATLQWQVGAQTIHPEAVGGPATPRWIVSPRYVAGGTTALTPVSRAAMTVRLTQQAFRLDARELEVIARVARSCDCYDLQVGDLGAACDAVMSMLDATP